MDKLDRDEALAAEIARCQEYSRKTYGYRRVQLWLEQQGIHRNPKTVLRIMRKYGLLSEIRRRKKYRVMGQQLHRYENLLNRDFTALQPNQKWVTDISYIHTAQVSCTFASSATSLTAALSPTKPEPISPCALYSTPSTMQCEKRRPLWSCSSTAAKAFNTPLMHISA